jgi:hypothetical protein
LLASSTVKLLVAVHVSFSTELLFPGWQTESVIEINYKLGHKSGTSLPDDDELLFQSFISTSSLFIIIAAASKVFQQRWNNWQPQHINHLSFVHGLFTTIPFGEPPASLVSLLSVVSSSVGDTEDIPSFVTSLLSNDITLAHGWRFALLQRLSHHCPLTLVLMVKSVGTLDNRDEHHNVILHHTAHAFTHGTRGNTIPLSSLE